MPPGTYYFGSRFDSSRPNQPKEEKPAYQSGNPLLDKCMTNLMGKLQKEISNAYHRSHLATIVWQKIIGLRSISDDQCRLTNLMETRPLYPLAPEDPKRGIGDPKKADRDKFKHPIEKRLEEAILYYEKQSNRRRLFGGGMVLSGKERWASFYYLSQMIDRLRERTLTQVDYEEFMKLPFRKLFNIAYSKLSPKDQEWIDHRNTLFSPWGEIRH